MKKRILVVTVISMVLYLPNALAGNGKLCDLTFEPLPYYAANDTGVLLETAEFWVNMPMDENASPLLRISKGTKLKILERGDFYFKVIHRNLVGYVEQRVVNVIEAVPAEPADQLVARGVDLPDAVEEKKVEMPSFEVAFEEEEAPDYMVTKETSLRQQPDSKARVLVRLPYGGKLKVLDSSGKWWWKVEYKGRTGWAKAALLER